MTDEFKFDTSQITTLDERFGKCPYGDCAESDIRKMGSAYPALSVRWTDKV